MSYDWLTTLKNSPVAARNRKLFEEKKKKQRQPAKPSKHVEWMRTHLYLWGHFKGYELLTEYKFHKFRKYRFDFAFLIQKDSEVLKIGIEYQGGIFMDKSGHSSAKGATRDTDKMNLAISEGWKVLTFTALNYKNVVTELEKNIKMY